MVRPETDWGKDFAPKTEQKQRFLCDSPGARKCISGLRIEVFADFYATSRIP